MKSALSPTLSLTELPQMILNSSTRSTSLTPLCRSLPTVISHCPSSSDSSSSPIANRGVYNNRTDTQPPPELYQKGSHHQPIMAAVSDSSNVDIPLLKDEAGGLMMEEGIASITFFKGSYQPASEALLAQLSAVVALNPWLAGRLVKANGKLSSDTQFPQPLPKSPPCTKRRALTTPSSCPIPRPTPRRALLSTRQGT